MGLLQYRGEFADSFDANDASDLLGFEARCAAQDEDIFRSAFAPGAGAPRRQMPPRREPTYDADGEADIADAAFDDSPKYKFER